MKHLSLILLSMTLMTAAKCQGLKKCPGTVAEFETFRKATMANPDLEKGLKNFKKLVKSKKIANCIVPERRFEPTGEDLSDKLRLLHAFAESKYRYDGQRNDFTEYHAEMIRHLVKKGAEIEASAEGMSWRPTPLMRACEANEPEMIRVLLELGSKPDKFVYTVGNSVHTTLESCGPSPEGIAMLLDTGIDMYEGGECYGYWRVDPGTHSYEEYMKRGFDEEKCDL